LGRVEVRGKTVREYRSMWMRYHIADLVAGRRVRDFETVHGSTVLKKIAAANLTKDGEPKLSKSTFQHIKFFLSGVFVLAKNEGYRRGENPM